MCDRVKIFPIGLIPKVRCSFIAAYYLMNKMDNSKLLNTVTSVLAGDLWQENSGPWITNDNHISYMFWIIFLLHLNFGILFEMYKQSPIGIQHII